MNPSRSPVAFLFDVDNTLLDNDRVIADLQSHLDSEVGAECAAYYWRIFEDIRTEIGHADYLGALQRFRVEYPHDPGIFTVSHYLLNYPFAERLFPGVPEVIAHVKQWGPAALLTDGDVVFQPWKVERSGLFSAVDGQVMIYPHKEQELDDVAERCPAEHYVLFEDKLRLLSAIKKIWGRRVTTVFVRQGHYALDPKILAGYPAADISLDAIGDLLQYDLTQLVAFDYLKRGQDE
ncbi:MAG: HAD family hydrolase [Planctomycetia bacterium]|nr:HAD family hydrolase [Planctomycetia bacterium]MCC7316298.1 HAD family hydrolase [Planctomycetota bacterium]OQZ06284.1 MAG: haloacid dehalogenase [Planctomycetes bacterium UTPLA1]